MHVILSERSESKDPFFSQGGGFFDSLWSLRMTNL